MIKLLRIILVALLIMPCSVEANKNYMFKHLTMEDGLSHNQVNSIYKDSQGFMWFCTAWGLNRYDGYEMQVFSNATDDVSLLQYNYVDWIKDYIDDKMFIKSGTNFLLFDKRTDKISSAISFFESIGIYDYIKKIYVDKWLNLWIVTGNKCYYYSSTSKELKLINSDESCYLDDRNVTIAEGENEIIIIRGDGTILRQMIKQGNLEGVAQCFNSPLTSGIHVALVDSDGDYWISERSDNSIWIYKSDDKKWEKCSKSINSLYKINSDFMVSSMCEDRDRKVWIAYDHGGVQVVDKHTNYIIELLNDPLNNRSLNSNCPTCIYADKQGTVWVGHVKSGISYYNKSTFKFKVETFDELFTQTNVKCDINSIEEDLSGNIWLGTNDNGLIRIDAHTGQRKVFRHEPNNPNSLSSNIIVDLFVSSDGNLWIGTYQGGLCRYDGTRFVRYMGRTDIAEPMAWKNIWSITEDNQKGLWIGSLGKGLVRYDLVTHETQTYSVANGNVKSNYISSLTTDKDGRVFVGTSSGLSIVNQNSLSTNSLKDEIDKKIQSNINDIIEDSRGLLWMGTHNGLYCADFKNNKLMHVDLQLGLADNVVIGIVEDNDKNIWVSTTNGVSSIVVNSNPRTHDYNFAIYNYSKTDGLEGEPFNTKSVCRTSYGEILVGSNCGLNCFVPKDIRYNKDIPNVTFTAISLFGNKIKIGEKIEDNVILSEAPSYCKNVNFNYSQNMFTIWFSTLSYILPEKVQYTYKLEGFNDKWITTTNPCVSYTNLAPGTYTFMIKAANCDGYCSDKTSEIKITVTPPWWKTNIMYVVYFLIFVTIAWIIQNQIKKRLNVQYKLRQIESEAKHKYEVDDMKLNFFTSLSHEFRTPISLIISPIEIMIETTTDPEARHKLELVHRNATKLLNMVNQLLDFRKIDANSMQLNESEGDLVAFAKQIGESFAALAERGLQFNITSQVKSIYMRFDNDKMSKILNNLLSNAFKFTTDEGRVDLWIGKSNDNQKAIIRVSDTGIGIPNESKPHIFDRFYQVSQQKQNAYGGSGIGLYLVKEFVTLHGGEISITDNIDHGSIFTITLPIKESQTDESFNDENIESEDELSTSEQQKSILIVDDNADFRTLLAETLSVDYKIFEARNGQEAFDIAVTKLPDLIISDVMMPIVDGIEFCVKVKNDIRISHIPFILLTAKIADEHKVEGLSSGADDYITKPFNPQILKLKVEKLIEIGKKRQEIFRKQIEPEPSEITITTLDEKLINKGIKYVEENMSKSELSVEELSRQLGMSRVHLYKKLLAITGRTPIEFIRVIRLKRAAQMLRDKQQNIADVAYAVGFNNPKYFSKYFRDEFGMLPSVFQNQQNDNEQINIDVNKE